MKIAKNKLIIHLSVFIFLVFVASYLLAELPQSQEDIRSYNVKCVNQFIADIPTTVAELSGKKLHKALLIQDLMPLLKHFKDTPLKLSETDMLKLNEAAKNSLNQLIEREILISLAEKDAVSVSQTEVDEQFAKIASSIKGGVPVLLEQVGITQASFKEKLASGLKIEKWLQNKFIPQFTPKEVEVEEYYRNAQHIFLIPEKAAISHIFLSSENFDDNLAVKKLESIRKYLTNADEFQKAARQNSEDERTKENGGALGEFALQELPQPFIDAIAKVPEGEISAPFKSFRGWHIVRVDKRTPSKFIPQNEAFPIIKKYLTEKTASTKLKELLREEKKARKYTIYLK